MQTNSIIIILIATFLFSFAIYYLLFTTPSERVKIRKRIKTIVFYVIASPGVLFGAIIAAIWWLITLWAASAIASIERIIGERP